MQYFIKMIRLSLYLSAVVFFFTSCTNNPKEECDLLISVVNLIDGTGKSLKPDQNVYIRNGKILEISEGKELYHTQKQVNGEGKFLIPGYLMHTFTCCTGKINLSEP